MIDMRLQGGIFTMPNQSEQLTDLEKKVAYVMGYDVDGPTLVEKLIARWQAYLALRRIHLSKTPIRVLLNVIKDGEQIEY
jgi:hypothetical protein